MSNTNNLLKELLSNSNYFHQIYDEQPTAIAICDKDGFVVDCNSAYTSTLGVKREDIIGYNIFDKYNFSDEVLNMIQTSDSYEYDTLYTLPKELIDKSLETIISIDVKIVRHYLDSYTIGYIIYITNHTNRWKEYNKKLSIQEKRYSDLVDNLPLNYTHSKLIFDENGKIVDYLNMTGNKQCNEFYKDHNMIWGETLASKFLPISGHVMFENLNRIRESGESGGHFIYNTVEIDEVNEMAVVFEGNEWVNIISIPVTTIERARMKAEEKLYKEEEEKIQLEKEHQKELEEQVNIFNALSRNFFNVYIVNLNDGSAKALKLNGYIPEGLNPNNKEIFEYSTILRNYIAKRVAPDDKDSLYKLICLENLRSVFNNNNNEFIGNYKVLIDGEIHNYQFNYSRLSKEFVIAGFQNIDAIINEHLQQEKIEKEKEQKYQETLIKAMNEANAANNAKTEFLLRMSHDIRTPINGITGMLDIAERYPNDFEKQKDCRYKIKEASKILLDLVNEVLDMSKLESGEIVLEHIPFDFVEVSKDVYYTIVKQADEENIEIVQEDCNVVHHNLIGSPSYIKRLMINIIGNAIKYNKKNGKIFITCKEISNDNSKAFIEFKCRDTGIGMSEEFLEHIFEPFAQENNTARSKYGGTGLGMSIVKKLVDKMGGTIRVESVIGEGSTFDVIIPLEINTSIENLQKIENNEEYSIDGLNILLAEDNELNMEISKFILEEEGAKVIEAWDGQEAVDKFKESTQNSIDVILMDVMMPKMDGYEATKVIRNLDREDSKTVPIIAMTANAFVEDKIKARNVGMNEHISKPLDTKLVLKTISLLTKKK